MIKKVLIANRGEIALRIMRTCKEMGIESCIIYSKADANSLAVLLSEESICIGGNRALDSYLNEEAVIQAALNSNCDAIHPGYGFLSESSEFAKKVIDNDLIYIGPSPKCIELMGDKISARNIAKELNIPVVMGSDGVVRSEDEALKIAESIGYPIILKAGNGGGGKGMRIAYTPSELSTYFNQVKSESVASFNSSDIYMEQYIENPRHIEVQIVADKLGHVVHLYDRNCSIQRRHQKLIEEAPAAHLDEGVRLKLYNDALKIAERIGYDSIGTIEFLVDQNNKYMFIEMNTRLQVEHTVTEMITGIDLVKEQIQSANGLPLKYEQDDIKVSGSAIECRINTEDMVEDFKPSFGTLTFLNLPVGKGVRLENSLYSGLTLAPYYDPMVLKVITHGTTRLQAIYTMRQALSELIIEGVETNVEMHYLCMNHKEFLKGRYSTHFFATFLKELKQNGTYFQKT